MTTHRQVTIIGAGIIGSSIAWRLSQHGVAARLIDAGRLGGEASWASAGMLAPGGEFTQGNCWIDMALDSLRAYPAFVEELSAESGAAIDYRACGAIETASVEQDWPALLDRAARQRSLGIQSYASRCQLHYPTDSLVNPRDLLNALRSACLRRGVRIFENSPVTSIDAQEDPIVIAAGAWSSKIEVLSLGKPVQLPEAFPVKGHLLGYGMPSGSLENILRCGHTYVLQRSNGFTIAGSTEEDAGFDRRIDPHVCTSLHRRASALWPELDNQTPAEAWIGFRPATRIGQPVIGRLPATNVWLAYGHYRNGVLLAPATANQIVSEIVMAHRN